MKILYVITKSNWGGAQRHVFDLATTMRDKGHDVWVALGGEGILKQKLEAAGIYTFSIAALGRDISPGKDAGSFKEIWNTIRNKGPDVLHLHSPKAAGLGALAGRLQGVKLIITTIHGWTWNEPRPWYERIAIALAAWVTMIMSHKTIVISERDRDQALHFPWVKDKLSLIPLGLKPPTFYSVDGAKQTLSRLAGLDLTEFSKKIVIGSIAELHPNKNQKDIVEAMATIADQQPNAICLLIGEGQDRIKLEQTIDERKLGRKIYLLGHMDSASEYLKAINIFVLPSLKEGLPYVLLEAGCASLPVVATTVGGIPEIIEDMKSGILIQPRNPRELAHALSFMIEHPEERRRYGAALKERVAARFSMERMVSSILEVYKPTAVL